MNRTALPAHLKARILESARREPSPDRQTLIIDGGSILAIGFAVMMNIFLAAGGAEADTRPRPLVLGTLLGWLSLAIASTWGALGRGGAMEGRPRRHLIALATAVPAAASAWMGAWIARYQAFAGSMPIADDSACFLLGLGLSVPALLALSWVRRDADVKHARATGAALGGAAGAWGGVFLDAHCPSLDVVHLALGHVLPLTILAVVGALMGRRLLREPPKGGAVSM